MSVHVAEGSAKASAAANNLTTLDRRVQIVLRDDDMPTLPSAKAGNISSSLQRLHALHGTSLIMEACQELKLGPSCYATACTMFHRYFHQVVA